MQLANQCESCKLSETRHNIVWGEGPTYAPVMFIGQDPGSQEDETGTPFYYLAPGGQEFDRLLGIAGLARENVYVTNSCKCHTPNDRGPTPDELNACRSWLLTEIAIIRPSVIVPMGGPATANLLGDIEMETVHGIPFQIHIPEIDFTTIVVPSYHPAAGLRNSDYALKAATDFTSVAAVLRGKLSPAHFRDPYAGGETYRILYTEDEIRDVLSHQPKFVAIDTETLNWNYDPFCVQFSTAPGTGYMILAHNAKVLAILASYVAQPDIITVIHNSLFDLFVLDKLAIYPSTVHDTMIMAYLLQTEPLGLKPLAFRFWGMKMKDYDEMVAIVSTDLAEKYLLDVLSMNWPDPDKIMQIRPDGKIHYKQPQNIRKVVERIFKDLQKGKIGRQDLWRRWHDLDPDETSRGLVEETLGEMPEGNLSMIPLSEAMWYSCRDPDATIRIYPYLVSQIEAREMTQVFEMDMGIIPMVKDMMETGLEPDLAALEALQTYFQGRMDEIYAQVKDIVGKEINLRSPQQVSDLLFGKFYLHQKYHMKFKKNKLSTDDKTLGRMVAMHPVVPLIRQWKGYNSLVTKYTGTLAKWVQEDGRIHAKISTTRTATGRLAASNPNIMNQPTRSEDGKKIRECFNAGDGKLYVSNDLSQIEMRVLGDQSGDPLLLDIFRNDRDIHSITASKIFGVPIEDLDEMKHRYPSKRVGFGVVYGITAAGLQEQLLMMGLSAEFWTIPRCQALIDEWFTIYHDVELYMEDLVSFALRKGYVVDMFGRRRYLETIRSSSPRARAEARRQAGNMPIQSGAAGIFKAGMKLLIPIYRDFLARGYYVRPVVPIHDDLVFEVEEDLVDIWVPLQQDCMENAVQLKVPIKSEAKVGKNWGKMEKYKR